MIAERCGLLDEQVFEGNGGQDLGDGFGGGAIAVGVGHAAEFFAECGSEGTFECSGDRGGIGGNVEDVAGAFAALLAHADVDDGKRERSRFHDAAGGVADHRINLAEEAPVGDGVEIDEDVGVGT